MFYKGGLITGIKSFSVTITRSTITHEVISRRESYTFRLTVLDRFTETL